MSKKYLNKCLNAIWAASLVLVLPITGNAAPQIGINNPTAPTMGHVYDVAKVEAMLRKEGFLTNSSHFDVTDYIKAAEGQYESSPNDDLYKESEKRKERILKTMKRQGRDDDDEDNKQGSSGNNRTIAPEKTDRVMAILIDFPDYPKNSVKQGETGMFYADYNVEHYQDLIFGANGYAGPSNQNLISARQFYEQQSGGSYSIEGKVVGWYRAAQPAAFYGQRIGSSSDRNPRALVREALLAVSRDPSVDMTWFDQEDRYDLDRDGNLREPDGLVDHIMVYHSSIGEEAGGGALGTNAIWSHRWNLGNVFRLPGTTSNAPQYWGGLMAGYDYTIEPIDAAAGVVAHEYGHDLGLPDEYDTAGGSRGEPVAYWSIMSSGSWAGTVPGTEPTGFSPWAKEFLQASLKGNWFNGATVNLADLGSNGKRFTLDMATNKGRNHDFVRVNVPDKVQVVVPTIGQYSYYSSRGDNLNTMMSTNVNLGTATTASLKFKVWYQIEEDWDYGRILVNGVPIAGSITTSNDPNGIGFGIGFTGHSQGWVDAEFNLSAYAGQAVTVSFNYLTDGFVAEQGYYVDSVNITADGQTIASFNAEADVANLALNGFSRDTGKKITSRYYLVEWRQHDGVDVGLSHLRTWNQDWSYSPGMVVWFIDQEFSNNHVGVRPGQGWLSVVDADQTPMLQSPTNSTLSTRWQIRDAAFSVKRQQKLNLVNGELSITDTNRAGISLFNDKNDYTNAAQSHAGVKIPNLGLIINLEEEDDCDGDDDDACVGEIRIQKAR